MLAWILLMATTIVSNIAVFSDQTGHGNQSHLVYAPVQQRWWLFYTDSKTATGVKVKVSSSADLTSATWGDPGSNTGGSGANQSPAFANTRAMSSNDQRNLGVAMVPNGINANDVAHVSVGIGTSASATGHTQHIRCKFTGSNSISWDSWLETDSSTNHAWGAIKGNCLGVATDGSIHDSDTTLDVNEDANARKASNVDTGSTWTNAWGANAIIDTSMTNACNAYAFAPLASAAMLLVYDNGGGTEPNSTGCRYQKYTSGTTWPTVGSGDTGVGSGALDQNQFSLCGVDTTHIYLFRNSTATAMNWRKFDGSSWTTPSNAVPAFGGTSFLIGSGFLTATDGTDLYLFALDSAGNNAIYYVKCSGANGATPTWGSWTVLESAGSVARNYLSGHPAVGNNQIGVIWTEVNGSNFDIVVSALSIAAPAQSVATVWLLSA